MKRAEGNYWVRVNEFRDWELALWLDGGWYFPGFMQHVKSVLEIDERRIERKPKDEIWEDLCSRMQQDIDKNPEWT